MDYGYYIIIFTKRFLLLIALQLNTCVLHVFNAKLN